MRAAAAAHDALKRLDHLGGVRRVIPFVYPVTAELEAFSAARAFVGLLGITSIKLGLAVSWDITRVALAAAAFVALMFRVSLLWVVLAGVLVAVIFRF